MKTRWCKEQHETIWTTDEEKNTDDDDGKCFNINKTAIAKWAHKKKPTAIKID